MKNLKTQSCSHYERVIQYWKQLREINDTLLHLDAELHWMGQWDHCVRRWNNMLKRNTKEYDPARDREFVRDIAAENKLRNLIKDNVRLHKALIERAKLTGDKIPPWLPKKVKE